MEVNYPSGMICQEVSGNGVKRQWPMSQRAPDQLDNWAQPGGNLVAW
jgi:hypothetical protein